MKKLFCFCMAAVMLLALAACAVPAKEPAPEDAPKFTVTTETYEEAHKAADGTELAQCSYELPYLEADGESEEARAAADAFNAGTALRLEELRKSYAELCEMADEDYAWKTEEKLEWYGPYAEESNVSDVYQSGALLSVTIGLYNFAGGAHPNNGIETWNFDLKTGSFFTWDTLADDPDALRGAMVDEILAQIEVSEERDGYYEDYAESVRALEGAHISFAEYGVHVDFEPYAIGPHALGMPGFVLPYELLRPYLNDYGKTLLGV